ncbi:alpha/beta fold hydrolase [Curtobacterium ammoniigenes]|uniref:alpha/beta fold hydrolase n=1 Tax=Curtobacterium ammoniigenes TaxID=395387 RepID=UPI000832EDCF|nr:alpha/beta hydrolase [Curtobacterium ammoniigenes]
MTDPTPAGALVVERTGAERGRPIVLVRGTAARVTDADRFVELLGERHPVFSVELPGFGAQPLPPGGRDLSVETVATALESTIDSLEITDPIIVGETVGAACVAAVAARRSDWNDVVMIAPGVDPEARTVSETLVRLAQSVRREPARIRWTAFVALLLLRFPVIRLLVRSLRFDIGACAPTIRSRVLLIRGEHDAVVPRSALRELARALPYGVIREVIGAGHYASASQPTAVAALIVAFADGAIEDRGVASLQRVGEESADASLDTLSGSERWEILRDRVRERFGRASSEPDAVSRTESSPEDRLQ